MYYSKIDKIDGLSNFQRYLRAKKVVNKYCEFYKLDLMGCEVLWMAKQAHLEKG